jgi:hypothetical protein
MRGGCLIAAALVLALGPNRLPADPPAEGPKVADYTKALKAKDPLVRRQVARALGELGAKARSAVPALREALLDPDEGVQSAAAAALEAIGPSGPVTPPEEVARLRAEIEALRRKEEAQAAEARARVAETVAQAEKLQAENRARAAAAEEAIAQYRQALDKEHLLQKETLRFRDDSAKLREELAASQRRSVAAEVESRALQERNAALTERMKELEKQLDRPSVKPTGPAPRAPANPVEGTVTEVDAAAGLVQISLGSDAGLEKGQTLEVYRLNADQPAAARYLGRIRVIDVTPKTAVGKRDTTTGGAVRVGDRVASQLNPAR